MPAPSVVAKEFPMCSPAVCGTCKKITYTGCGMHLDQVFANVRDDQRCTCR
jgi:hypothetical protein